MIFDTPEITELCLRYADEPDFAVPDIVYLARSQFLAREREEIEQIMQQLPESVQKEWRFRVVSIDHNQHKSVWFQIMLFSWLSMIGNVSPEPGFLGNQPDFLLEIDGEKIAIEAKAILLSEEKRKEESWKQEVLWLLNGIQEPSVIVHIKKMALVSRINASEFLQRVAGWLHSTQKAAFQYEDGRGNQIELEIIGPSDGGVATLGPSSSFCIDSSRLKRPLQKKANQHKAIRKSEYPYLIGIYLEDKRYSPEDIVEAWFGKQVVIVDRRTAKVVDQRLDMSGIHYFDERVRHRSVSGTLVFHDEFNERERRRMLRGWYIQNPYAIKPVEPRIFPVASRFVVLGQTEHSYQMGWERDDNEEGET